jgi:cytochrome c1
VVAGESPPLASAELGAGDAAAGRALVSTLACGACHAVPGIRGADGTVGPSLAGFGRRNLIAGTIPNEAAALAAFVRNAPSLVPSTAMPPMPLTESQARDVAAFLLALR